MFLSVLAQGLVMIPERCREMPFGVWLICDREVLKIFKEIDQEVSISSWSKFAYYSRGPRSSLNKADFWGIQRPTF